MLKRFLIPGTIAPIDPLSGKPVEAATMDFARWFKFIVGQNRAFGTTPTQLAEAMEVFAMLDVRKEGDYAEMKPGPWRRACDCLEADMVGTLNPMLAAQFQRNVDALVGASDYAPPAKVDSAAEAT